MATVYYTYRSKKESSKLTLVFTHQGNQTTAAVNVIVFKNQWDQKKQVYTGNSETVLLINQTLTELKHKVLSHYTQSTIKNTPLNKMWVKDIVNPQKQTTNKLWNDNTPFTTFIKLWLNTKSENWVNISTNKRLTDNSIYRYTNFLQNLELELKELNLSPSVCDFNSDVANKYVGYLISKNYSKATINTKVRSLYFFIKRAEENNLNTPNRYKHSTIIPKKPLVKDPYLTLEQVQLVFNATYQDQEKNIARKLFVIGLLTGMRFVDLFNNVNDIHINNDFIIFTPQKTKNSSSVQVTIPIHPMVKIILQEHNGLPPRTLSYKKFNQYIKEICKDLNFDKITYGGIMKKPLETKNTKSGRSKGSTKVYDYYPFYELVSSHIMRKSCATNLYGKVSNFAIMEMMGWKSEPQMLDYIKMNGIQKVNSIQNLYRQ